MTYLDTWTILGVSFKHFIAYINIESKLSNTELLFGECLSIIIVSINEEDFAILVLIS